MISGRSERGSITALLVGLTSTFLLALALVVDGGLLLASRRHVLHEAQAAARAGAQQLDVDALYRGESRFLPAEAEASARQLVAAGATVEVIVTPTRIQVVVRRAWRPTLLNLPGIRPRTVTGIAIARPARGITEEEP